MNLVQMDGQYTLAEASGRIYGVVVGIVLVALDAIDDKVIGEWRLEAMFTQAVLYDDRLLIEPTGGAVRLPGASVAEFRDHRIRAFRHYFDDSELLAEAPGSPSHLRWELDR